MRIYTYLPDLKLDLEMLINEDFNMQFKPSMRISFFKWIRMDNMTVLLYLPFGRAKTKSDVIIGSRFIEGVQSQTSHYLEGL